MKNRQAPVGWWQWTLQSVWWRLRSYRPWPVHRADSWTWAAPTDDKTRDSCLRLTSSTTINKLRLTQWLHSTATHTHIATLLRKGLTTLLVTHTHTGTLGKGLTSQLVVAALRSRCGHYIFALWFLSFFLFFLPRLISAGTHYMSTILPHKVLR